MRLLRNYCFCKTLYSSKWLTLYFRQQQLRGFSEFGITPPPPRSFSAPPGHFRQQESATASNQEQVPVGRHRGWYWHYVFGARWPKVYSGNATFFLHLAHEPSQLVPTIFHTGSSKVNREVMFRLSYESVAPILHTELLWILPYPVRQGSPIAVRLCRLTQKDVLIIH